MSVQTDSGSVSLSTSSGLQSVTGMAFQPKAILFSIVAVSTAGVIGDNYQHSFGFAKNAAGGYSASMSNANDLTTTDAKCTISNTQIWRVHDLIGTGLDFTGAFVSMNADGFTWNNVDNPPSGYNLVYLAIGGDDITDVEIGEHEIDASTLGNKSVTGLGFQPDFVLMLSRNSTSSYNTVQSDIRNNIGFATGPNNQGTLINKGTDGGTNTEEFTYQRTTSFMAGITGSEIQWEAEFVSMDADGFTYNIIDTVGSTRRGLFLAIKGGQWHVNNFLAKTSSGVFDITDAGFEAKGLCVMSNMKVASANVVNDTMLSLGLSDMTDSGRVTGVTGEGGGQPDSNTSQFMYNSSIQRTLDHLQGTVGRIDIDGALPTGFRLDQANPDDNATECLYFCVGDDAVVGGGGKLVDDNPLLGNKLIGGTLIG